jgi:hypothetical protein
MNISDENTRFLVDFFAVVAGVGTKLNGAHSRPIMNEREKLSVARALKNNPSSNNEKDLRR